MDLEELQRFLGIEIPEQEEEEAEERSEPPPAEPASRSSADPATRQFHDSALAGESPVTERLMEVEMASRLGYLLCHCSWPPQIMVLSEGSFVYRCPRCGRVRDF